MNDRPPSPAETIVNNLSNLIRAHAHMVSSEEHHPSSSADESDERIQENKKIVAELRAIREHFEDVITGMLP